MKKKFLFAMLIAVGVSLCACGDLGLTSDTNTINIEQDRMNEEATKKEVKETELTTIDETKQAPTTQTPTTQPPTTQAPTQISTQTNFQNIYDEYVNKMDAKIGDVYIQLYTGISDINTLETICLDGVEKLTDICDEGIDKMVEVYVVGGYDYSTYESWAKKLQNKYVELLYPISSVYSNYLMQ